MDVANSFFIFEGLMNETLLENEIYDDPYMMLNTRVPRRSIQQKWTFLRSDKYIHRAGASGAEPFILNLKEIRQIMGTTEDIQVRTLMSFWKERYLIFPRFFCRLDKSS